MGSEPVRLQLDAASWVEVHRGWIDEPLAAALLASLTAGLRWSQAKLFRYDHHVDEPRLGAMWRMTDPPPHPALPELHRRVRTALGVPFGSPAFAWYRDGRDGQAFHRDRDMRWCEDTLIAILTLGATRPWLLRPTASRYDHDEARFKGATHDLAPAAGDLLVMGGRCQLDWEHSVPQVQRPVSSRVSIQWRWTSRRGRPEVGASYRAPRTFSRRA